MSHSDASSESSWRHEVTRQLRAARKFRERDHCEQSASDSEDPSDSDADSPKMHEYRGFVRRLATPPGEVRGLPSLSDCQGEPHGGRYRLLNAP